MKAPSDKHVVWSLVTAACLLLVAPATSRAGKETWISVRSQNFFLVGNAGERDIRQVAASLEQFRDVCQRLLGRDYFDPSVPVTIIVFRDNNAYRPFKPLSLEHPDDVAGYFQADADVDYITICLDLEDRRNPGSLGIHEYLHLLVKNKLRGAPLWFKEGLAEYYSTAEVSKDHKITLGRPIRSRVSVLRDQELLPLQKLLTADYYSPYYVERDQRGLFYAESWALVHYLLSGKGGARRAQLSCYLNLAASGMPVEESFAQAFQTSFAAVEKELRGYIYLARYPEQVKTFDEGLGFSTDMQVASLREAEVEAYLGDLLLHSDRLDEAAGYLHRAVALDPQLARADTSLGILRLRQNLFGEAKQHLQRAMASDPQYYLAHYYYADVLGREGLATELSVKGYAETTNVIRAELKKAIELAPGFVEPYRLLSSVELERGGHLDEAVTLLRQALAISPRRQDVTLLLAQVYLSKGELSAARRLLEAVIHDSIHPYFHTEAQKLLATARSREEALGRPTSADNEAPTEAFSPVATEPCDMPQPGPQLKKLRFNGEQVCGRLVSIECAETGVMLSIDTGGRTLRLRRDAFSSIRFVSYTAEIKGRLSCGLRTPPVPVLVTYRSDKRGATKSDGEVIAVEFVPEEWGRER